ncbi:MAG: TniQ family protein [Brevundimonas diminuta]|nr:TniQ family protein [Brevundimonas diminuta]
MSSWFLRAAEAMEMKPYALGHIAWRSTPPPLTRDIDGIADDRILAILSASTLTPIEQCRATTLASYEGVLFESHQPLGRTAWIMPLGVRARTRLSPGLQYCPACMQQSPYYRRLWRVSWATACVEHKLRLLDRCSHCASILAPFRARGFACFNCGAVLADGQRLPASEMVLRFQMRQEAILAQGWGELGPSHFPYSVQYFQTIRHVARSLSLGARATAFHAAAAETWGGDPSPHEGEKRDIDVLAANDRHRLFDLVSRLLEDWPERFVSAAEAAGLWQSWALRDDERPPFAYASMVADRLATPRYSPSRAEVQSAADYLRRRSSSFTKLALKNLVGDSIHIQPIFEAERQASLLPAFREVPSVGTPNDAPEREATAGRIRPMHW